MIQGVKLKETQKIEKAKRICEKYALGTYTLLSCCESEGISDNTFRKWCNDISDISDSFKNAQTAADNQYKKELKEKAKTALTKLIEGFESVESFQEGVPDKKGKITTTKVTTKKRFIGPNPIAVIFALTNVDSENFKHKNETAVTGKIQVENVAKLTDEELEAQIKELEKGQKAKSKK